MDRIDELHARQAELTREYCRYREGQVPGKLLVDIVKVQDELMTFVCDRERRD